MPSGRLRSLLPALLGLTAFGAIVSWFGIVNQQRPDEDAPPSAAALPPRDDASKRVSSETTANAAPPVETPAAPESLDAIRDLAKSSPPASPGQARTAPPAETGQPNGPSFDVVRVEPSGDSVIAGRGAPGATIEMSRNGKSHARAIADTSGLFAFVPPPLRPGSHEISLLAIAPDGTRAQSRDSVTVVINEDRTTKPLVTLTSPDRPTVVLSAPDPTNSKTAAVNEGIDAFSAAPEGPQPLAPRPGIKIASVEAEEGGRLFVSGSAASGATVRLYLNESFIAPGGTGSDGKVSFAIGRGVRPGEYRVRLDDVDPVSGHVKSRSEVAFNVPAPLTVPLPPQAPPLVPGSDLPGATVAGRFGAGATGSPGSASQSPNKEAAASERSMPAVGRPSDTSARGMDPGTIVVPEINTTMVARGDNLWRMSRRIYGQGTRYTVIYDANDAQIRNPDRIYPGQMFVVPSEQPPAKPR